MSVVTAGWVVIPRAGQFPWPPAGFVLKSPTTGTVTNKFNEAGYYDLAGVWHDYRCHLEKSTWGHPGVDIAPGAEVQPALPGYWQVGLVGSRVQIAKSGFDQEMGNYALLDHASMPLGFIIYTFYAHLDRIPPAPSTIWDTDTFAYASNTGSAGTGMHLHFEVRARVADHIEYRTIHIKQNKAPDRLEHQMRVSYDLDWLPRPWTSSINENCKLYCNPQRPTFNNAGQFVPIWSSAVANQ